MFSHLRPALVLVLAMTLLTGLAYPLAITGIAQIALPFQANGSLIENDGRVIGSKLIGQDFTSDRYFWPRPSATAPSPYNPASSSGSNLGATSTALRDRVRSDLARLSNTGLGVPMPADAVMASGSGLDPHISPDYARLQIDRIATERRLENATIAALVDQQIEKPALGIFGEPRVNVLELNLALDAVKQ